MERLSLSWDQDKFRGRRTGPGPADGLPALSISDLARAIREKIPPWQLLREKFSENAPAIA